MILNNRRTIVIWLVALVVLSVGIINLSFSTQNTTASPKQKAGSSSSNDASANVGDPNVNIEIDLGSKLVKDSTIDVGVDVKIDACCGKDKKDASGHKFDSLIDKVWKKLKKNKINPGLQGQALNELNALKMQGEWLLEKGYYNDIKFYDRNTSDATITVDNFGIAFNLKEQLTQNMISFWSTYINPNVETFNVPEDLVFDFYGYWQFDPQNKITIAFEPGLYTGEVFFTYNYSVMNLRLLLSNAIRYIDDGIKFEFVLVFSLLKPLIIQEN